MNLDYITHNWFVWAVLASIFMAVIAHFNHQRRLDPQYLNAWQSTFAALMLVAAAVPLAVWPSFDVKPIFYGMAAANGLVMAFGMVVFFWMATRRTARVTSMVIPLAALAAYTTWWLVVPEGRVKLMEHPFKVYISVIAICVICFAIQRLRRNDASWETFTIILPVGVAFGVRDALVKWVVGGELNIFRTALSFTSISVLVCAGLAWLATLKRPAGWHTTTNVFDKSLLWGSFWCGFWTVGMLVSGVIALTLAPNPAYPGIVMTMTPLWLYGYNYFNNIHDEVSPGAGAVIIGGTVVLLLSNV